MKHSDKIHLLLQEFKNGKFIYGPGCLDHMGETASAYGNRYLVIADRFPAPHIAIQSAASSAAHLTKYSNITNLENMPVPMTPGQVDNYMGSILRSAATGDLSLIRSMN